MAESNQNKKKGFNPVLIVVIILILAVVVAVPTIIKKQVQKVMGGVGTPVDAETVQLGSLSQVVELSGIVQSEESKTYFAPVSAKIDNCDLKEGDLVKAGDLLTGFDTSDLEQQLEVANLEQQVSTYGSDITIRAVEAAQQKAGEAQVKYDEAGAYVAHFNEAVGSIQTQLTEAASLQNKQATLAASVQELTASLAADPENKKLQKELKKAQKELDGVNKKLEGYDVAQLQAALEVCSGDLAEYKALREQYDAQKEQDPTAGLQKQQQAVSKELAKKSSENLESIITKARQGVRCEFDGVVVEAAAKEGMVVSEGMSLFTVQSTKDLKVTIPVGKNDLEKIKEGQQADIRIGGKEYTGSVENISRLASATSGGAVAVDVDIHIDDPDDGIIIGTEGKVSIETAEKKDIVTIPMVCLNFSSDSTFVYLIKDGKLTRSDVQTGISDDENIEIISGVSEGDEVVRNVPADATEGMEVIAKHENTEEQSEEKEK